MEITKKSIFIDAMFSLVLTIGLLNFCQTFFGSTAPIILTTQLLNQDLGIFVIGLLTVSFSWFGYHRTIDRFPHKDRLWGMARFMIDVLLLFSYSIILYNYRSIEIALLGICLSFILYIIWDIFTRMEYKKIYRSRYLLKSILVALLLISVLILYLLKIKFVQEWIVLIIFIIIIGYRLVNCLIRVEVKREKIYIAGPYSSTEEGGHITNTNIAIDLGIKILKMGHYPYIPHLTHWVDEYSKKANGALKWEDYLDWDLEWLKTCDSLYFIGQSKGANLELKIAKKTGLKIYYSLDEIDVIKDKNYKDEVLQELNKFI